jgi:hypothetical protein
MKTITYKMLMENNACYDPKVIGMPEDYEGTPLEFIREYRSKVKRPDDIVWVLTRRNVVNKSLLHEFALFCGNQVRHLMKDERSIKALDITRAYLDGKATREELETASKDAIAVNKENLESISKISTPSELTFIYAASASASASVARAAAHHAASDAIEACVWACAPECDLLLERRKLCDQQIDKIIELLEGE